MFSGKFNQKKCPQKLPRPAARVSHGSAVGRLPLFDANQILFDHACDTMPDSLARRRLVLQALKIKAHPRHLAYAQICAQLAAVESVAELNQQLLAALTLPAKSSSSLPETLS
jgi:hypothetical protein